MKRTHAMAIIAAGLLLGAADLVQAQGDLSIQTVEGEATDTHATKTYNANTGGWNVTLHALYNPGNVSLYELHGTGGVVIDNLIIDVPCWTDSSGDCIPAGSPVFVRVLSMDDPGVKTVHNIIQTGDAETLLTHVKVTEDIGFIQAEAIGVLEAGRDILGPVISITPDNWVRGIGEAWAERDVRGDMIAMNGRIGIVNAERFIGFSNDPVEIRARHNSMIVEAGQAVFADISTRENGGEGRLTRLITPHFTGSVSTLHLGEGWPDEQHGLIQVSQQFNGFIEIGDSHDNDEHWIELPIGGVNGQIIINADNEPGGKWTAPIKIGSDDDPDQIILTGPGYDVSSDELGGAFGLVPFHLHGPSCFPQAGGEVIQSERDGPLVVRVEHDGPVAWSDGTPVIIERRPLEGGAFQPMSISQFFIFQSVSNPRALLIDPIDPEGGFQPGYEYRIQPTSNLVSDVADQPQVVWSAPYTFTVEAEIEPEQPCSGDVNDDAVVNVDDLLLLLNQWGPAPEGGSDADVNGDDAVNVDDLLMLLNNWGPC